MKDFKSIITQLMQDSVIKSGFNDIDQITYGWQNGNLIMIAAPARMGKTPFALSMLLNAVDKFDYSFMWFSTYLSVNQLGSMLICNQEGITSEQLSSKKTNDKLMTESISKNKFISLYFDDQPNLNSEKINRTIESFIENNVPDCIIVDDLNYLCLNSSNTVTDVYDSTNIKLLGLKSLARKFNIPVIVLYECDFPENMGSEFEIEQIKLDFKSSLVDTLCFLFRPEYYKVIEYGNGVSTLGNAHFIIAQNRGLTGEVILKYDPIHFKFN
jgi:replicative DNA helicase